MYLLFDTFIHSVLPFLTLEILLLIIETLHTEWEKREGREGAELQS